MKIFSLILIAFLANLHAQEAKTHVHADGKVCTGDHSASTAKPAATAHVHADGKVCTGDHSANTTKPAATAHVHEDGKVCTGDHSANTTKPAATAHVHEDGKVCTGDHSASTAKPAATAHVHADGKVCTGDHSTSTAKPAATTHVHADGKVCTGDHSEPPSIISIDARARHLINMQTEVVHTQADALTSSVYGYLSVPDHALKSYSLPSSGRIELHVKSAQQVEKGEVLFSVESPEFSELIAQIDEAQANLMRNKQELEALENRHKRLQEAGARNSDIEEQILFKKAEVRQMEQALRTSQSRLRMLSMGAKLEQKEGRFLLTVAAAEAGTVRNVGINEGSWGEQGTSVITMNKPDALEITATLYASDQPNFSTARAFITVGNENIAVDGELRMDEQIDAQTQTRKLYFTPTNLPAGVRAGQLCRIDLFEAAPAGNAWVSVPDSAIIKIGVDDVAFVDLGENNYAAIKVKAGESRRGMTPVLGLTPGQKLVTKGGYELKFVLPSDGPKKSAGHFHADGKFCEGDH